MSILFISYDAYFRNIICIYNMTTVKRRIRRPKKATKKVSKRTSKKRVSALKSKSNRHTRRNKSKHHGGVKKRDAAELTSLDNSKVMSKRRKRICRTREDENNIKEYINTLIINHPQLKVMDEERLSDKPMPSILRSLTSISTVDIIGTPDQLGMNYDDVLQTFKTWRKLEATRRKELRHLKKQGVSSLNKEAKETINDSDAVYNASMTILNIQEEREIDKEIDDDALRDMQECKNYTDPPPTITIIPHGFTPEKKKVTASSIEPIGKKPLALFGRPKKNDGDSDSDLDNFMNDVEGYDN